MVIVIGQQNQIDIDDFSDILEPEDDEAVQFRKKQSMVRLPVSDGNMCVTGVEK